MNQAHVTVLQPGAWQQSKTVSKKRKGKLRERERESKQREREKERECPLIASTEATILLY